MASGREVRFRPHPFEGKSVLSVPTAVAEALSDLGNRDFNGWTWAELSEDERRTAVVLITLEVLEREHAVALGAALDEAEDLAVKLARANLALARTGTDG